MTTPTVRQAKVLRVLFLMRTILANARTIEDMAILMNVHVRSAFRYLRLIEKLGIEVKSRNSLSSVNGYKKMYYIDQCPCCGRKKGES